MPKLIPIFAGSTPDRELIVLYKSPDELFHLMRPDGEIWALSPGAHIDMHFFLDVTELHIQSPEWTGTAKGTREDLVWTDVVNSN